MQQYFINDKIHKEQEVYFSKEQAHHIKRVLRMKDNGVVKVVDIEGNPFLVELVVMDEVFGKVVEVLKKQTPKKRIYLFQGMIKGERWDYVIQKACELGVYQIIPVISSRTIVKISDKIDKKVERYNKIALEACEQSRQDHLVEVLAPIPFKEIVNFKKDFNLVAYEDADVSSAKLKDVLANNDCDDIAVVIGSEGGFSKEEVAYLNANGFLSVSLGERILRAETAAMATINSILFYYE